jgi:O-antigen ligase
MVKSVCAFFMVAFIILPLNLTLTYLYNKPDDLVFSDLLLLFLPFAYFAIKDAPLDNLLRGYTISLVVYLIYCSALIYFEHDINSNVGLSILSFLRATRPFLLFYIGYLAYTWSEGKVERWTCYLVLVLTVVLFVSNIFFNHAFPNPRWGGYFFQKKVYGFPNSAGSYYVVCLAILIFGSKYLKERSWAFILGTLIMSLTIVFIGSRNAIAALLLLFAFLFLFSLINRKHILWLIPLMTLSMHLIKISHMNLALMESKVRRTLGVGVFYGRSNIWSDTLNIIHDKFLFGYGFEPLSLHYNLHTSTHNQYLEYIYKSGFIGSLFIINLWLYVIRSYFSASKVKNDEYSSFYAFLFCGFLVVLISNMAQSNLTYTITQSFFIFFAGVAVARIGQHHRFNSRINQDIKEDFYAERSKKNYSKLNPS